MKKIMSTSQNAHSTTEELIVSYLDGELMRKELEVELFERLATHADARKILREYLVVRGAIHASESDERFQLSDAVDQRTRARLQSMLSSIPQLEASSALATRNADRSIVATLAVDRRLKTWSKRLAPALLLLLLAVGSTWYITHSLDQGNQSIAGVQTTPSQAPINSPSLTTNAPTGSVATQPTQAAPAERTRIVREYIQVPQAPKQAGEVAQSTAQTNQLSTAKQNDADPKDVMASHRFAKLIHNTPSVLVTQQDRL
jgi:hypothetical protein